MLFEAVVADFGDDYVVAVVDAVVVGFDFDEVVAVVVVAAAAAADCGCGTAAAVESEMTGFFVAIKIINLNGTP